MLFCVAALAISLGISLLDKLGFASLYYRIKRMERAESDFTSFMGQLEEGVFIFLFDEA